MVSDVPLGSEPSPTKKEKKKKKAHSGAVNVSTLANEEMETHWMTAGKPLTVVFCEFEGNDRKES